MALSTEMSIVLVVNAASVRKVGTPFAIRRQLQPPLPYRPVARPDAGRRLRGGDQGRGRGDRLHGGQQPPVGRGRAAAGRSGQGRYRRAVARSAGRQQCRAVRRGDGGDAPRRALAGRLSSGTGQGWQRRSAAATPGTSDVPTSFPDSLSEAFEPSGDELQDASAFKCVAEGDLVGILEVDTDRNAAGEPR